MSVLLHCGSSQRPDPVGTTCVEWLQNSVAAFGIEEFRSELECRIIHNRTLFPGIDLQEKLLKNGGLAAARVTTDHDARGFSYPGNL